MFKNVKKKVARIAILLLLLGVCGTSLISDIPIPTEEAAAGIIHRCCDVQCYVDGLGRVHCLVYNCRWVIHLPWTPDPC